MPGLLDFSTPIQQPVGPAAVDLIANPNTPDTYASPDAQAMAAPAAAPAPSDPTSGLLAAVQTAAQDPDASHGLLQAFGDKLSNISQSIKGMSPAASQGLLATGLGILANNDGTRNLGQLVGLGGMSGLNAYADTRNMQNANDFARAKLAQQAQQQAFENKVAVGKLGLEQQAAGKPFEVNGQTYVLGPNGYSPMSGTQLPVARTQEIKNADGSTSVLQLDKFGNPVGSAIATGPSAANMPIRLSPDQIAQKNVEANAAISAGQQKLAQFDNIDQQFSQPGLKSGIGSKISRQYNDVTGSTDTNSQVRQNYDAFRTSFINQALPPGSASDADIKNAQATAPLSDASPDAIHAWIKTAKTAQAKINAYNQAQNDFVNSSMGGQQTIRDVTLPDGTVIPQGTNFNDFMQKRGLSVGDSSPQQQAQQTQTPVINPQAVSGLSQQQQSIVQQAVASGNPQAIAKLRAKGYIR